MLILLLLLYFAQTEAGQRPSRRFPDLAKRLHDEPVPELPSPFGNKVYLKNKLLNNLNSFFPNPGETLEIFAAAEDDDRHEHQQQLLQQQQQQQQRQRQPTDDSNSIVETPTPAARGETGGGAVFPPVQDLREKAFISRGRGHTPFPTLIPTFESPSTTFSPAASFKKRSEGPIVSARVLDSIRDWRKRLYRAFKSKKSKLSSNRIVDNAIARHVAATPTSEVVDFKDLTPLVVDKNRQVLLSRREPNWQTALAAKNVQTFGREPGGKMTRLFGTEASGYHSKPLNESPPVDTESDYLPLSPLSSNRKAYRTPGGRNVVYIPASHITVQPPPMTAPPPTLPAMYSMPYPPGNPFPEFSTASPYQFNSFTNQMPQEYSNYNSPAPQPPALPTLGPIFTTTFASDLEETEENLDSECTGEPTCVPDQTVSEDRCNSLRLRTIIQSNIVANDAEASKRAVQSAAETETGQFFDAVCGTGFFSYIAHTDEFCLASMAGVNCYVFSPVCSDHPTTIFAKHRKSRRKVYLNRN